MLYPEFEAILDGVVGMPDLAGQSVLAAYLRISASLHIKALVFFRLGFTADGQVDHDWNLPLRRLANQAGTGPDLGAGPVRLACAGHCPLPEAEPGLWDPLLRTPDVFAQLQELVGSNQLRLMTEDDEPELVVPPGASASDLMQMLDTALRDHHSGVAATGSSLEGQLRQEVSELQQALGESCQQIEKLSEDLQVQTQALQAAHEELAETLESCQQTEVELEQVRAEALRQSQAQMRDFQDQLAQRESDWQRQLENRQALLDQARQEIADLQADQQLLSRELEQLKPELAEHVFQDLASSGMTFTAYHPGAGQLRIPVEDLPAYRKDPVSYAARRAGLSVDVYRQWLEHYMNPVCQARLSDGSLCQMPIDRAKEPQHFESGLSNACLRHKGHASFREQPVRAPKDAASA